MPQIKTAAIVDFFETEISPLEFAEALDESVFDKLKAMAKDSLPITDDDYNNMYMINAFVKVLKKSEHK